MVVEKLRNLSRNTQLCPALRAFPEVSSIEQTAAFNPGDDGQRLIVIAVITARTVPILCKCPGIDSFLRWRRQVAKRDGPVFPQAPRSRTLIHLPQTLSPVRSDDAFLGTNRPAEEPAQIEATF